MGLLPVHTGACFPRQTTHESHIVLSTEGGGSLSLSGPLPAAPKPRESKVPRASRDFRYQEERTVGLVIELW
jgi:hypothetical protein